MASTIFSDKIVPTTAFLSCSSGGGPLSAKQPQQPLEGSNSYAYLLGEHSEVSLCSLAILGMTSRHLQFAKKNRWLQEVPGQYDNIG